MKPRKHTTPDGDVSYKHRGFTIYKNEPHPNLPSFYVSRPSVIHQGFNRVQEAAAAIDQLPAHLLDLDRKGNFWLTEDLRGQPFGPRFRKLSELVAWSLANITEAERAGYTANDHKEDIETPLDEVLIAFEDGELPEDLTFF